VRVSGSEFEFSSLMRLLPQPYRKRSMPAAAPVPADQPLLHACRLCTIIHSKQPACPRRLFLRAIGACPWAKALWCDGLALLNGRAPPKELSGEASCVPLLLVLHCSVCIH